MRRISGEYRTRGYVRTVIWELGELQVGERSIGRKTGGQPSRVRVMSAPDTKDAGGGVGVRRTGQAAAQESRRKRAGRDAAASQVGNSKEPSDSEAGGTKGRMPSGTHETRARVTRVCRPNGGTSERWDGKEWYRLPLAIGGFGGRKRKTSVDAAVWVCRERLLSPISLPCQGQNLSSRRRIEGLRQTLGARIVVFVEVSKGSAVKARLNRGRTCDSFMSQSRPDRSLCRGVQTVS